MAALVEVPWLRLRLPPGSLSLARSASVPRGLPAHNLRGGEREFIHSELQLQSKHSLTAARCGETDNKTSHKGPVLEIEMYTAFESWINKLSFNVWFTLLE